MPAYPPTHMPVYPPTHPPSFPHACTHLPACLPACLPTNAVMSTYMVNINAARHFVLIGVFPALRCLCLCLWGLGLQVKAAQEDPYVIPKSIALQIQGGFLLASLLSALIIVPASGFYIGKKFGVWLWFLYAASMSAGLYVEISGGNV